MPTLERPSAAGLHAVEPNELVRRAAAGCADSFAELSRRFRPRLTHLVERRFGNRRDDAEDVAQEALAKAFHGLDRFDHRYQFSTWLYTIAIRVAHDYAKIDRRRPPHVSLDATIDAAVEAPSATAVDEAEEAANVWRLAQQSLTDEQYAALWLRYGEDLSPAEVAKVMGRSRIAVRVMLHRARRILVDRLGEPP